MIIINIVYLPRPKKQTTISSDCQSSISVICVSSDSMWHIRNIINTDSVQHWVMSSAGLHQVTLMMNIHTRGSKNTITALTYVFTLITDWCHVFDTIRRPERRWTARLPQLLSVYWAVTYCHYHSVCLDHLHLTWPIFRLRCGSTDYSAVLLQYTHWAWAGSHIRS